MLAAERRHAILRALNAGGPVRVADLAAELDVSEMTVRRDLDALDAQEPAAQGARRRGDSPQPRRRTGVVGEGRSAARRKAAIAALAAETVEDGMTIAISAGTTTTELARRLRRRSSITVVTNSIQRLRGADRSRRGCRRRAAGVSVRRCPHPVGCARRTDRRRCDLVVPGGRHVSRRHMASIRRRGLTTPNIAEAQTNRTLIGIGAQLTRAGRSHASTEKWGPTCSHGCAEWTT